MPLELIPNQSAPLAPTATINAGDTTWSMPAGAVPTLVAGAGEYRAILGTAAPYEYALVTAVTAGGTWTVVRAQEGSTAISVAAGVAAVSVGLTAANLAAMAQTLNPQAVQTAAFTAATDNFYPVSTTSTSVPVALPSAPADKSTVQVKVVAGTVGATGLLSNACTITCGGTDVLNVAAGPTSVTLAALNAGTVLQYQASTGIWFAVDDSIPLAQMELIFDAIGAAAATPLGLVGAFELSATFTNSTVGTWVPVDGAVVMATLRPGHDYELDFQAHAFVAASAVNGTWAYAWVDVTNPASPVYIDYRGNGGDANLNYNQHQAAAMCRTLVPRVSTATAKYFQLYVLCTSPITAVSIYGVPALSYGGSTIAIKAEGTLREVS